MGRRGGQLDRRRPNSHWPSVLPSNACSLGDQGEVAHRSRCTCRLRHRAPACHAMPNIAACLDPCCRARLADMHVSALAPPWSKNMSQRPD
eukprot:2089923-Alexandrium_andersonii.AAC.1